MQTSAPELLDLKNETKAENNPRVKLPVSRRADKDHPRDYLPDPGLVNAIEAVKDDYDYILIDCPPSLGLLTVNGLTAASEVLVPIQCEYYALEGLGQLLRNVDLVRRNLNPTLIVSTIVCVMYDARTKLADQVVKEVREHFGDKVMRTVVPRTVRLSEAPSFGQPIITFDSSSRGAVAYRMVAKEVSASGTPRGTR